MNPLLLSRVSPAVLVCVLMGAVISNSALSREAEERAKQARANYSAWQYQPDKARYWCTYSYTSAAGRPSYQYVLYYPDEARRGNYYWQNRSSQIWACCVRPGAPDYNRQVTKWYRQDKNGKWVRRADGESPTPPDGRRPIASEEDGPLPVPPPSREFEALSDAERKLAQRFHEALAEITIENGKIVAVDFSASEVDGKLLAELRNATALRRIYLDSTNVTDDGLKQVADASGVRHLDLSQTQASDAGLKHLAGMKSLETLVVRGCHGITASGVKELKKNRPKLLVTGPGEGSGDVALP